MKHNKVEVSWDSVDIGVAIITSEIQNSKQKFDGIYAIPRGGLVVGVMLSHTLNLPLLLYPTENTLVVDDISDTGKTLQRIKHKKIACLFNAKWTKTKPDYFAYYKQSKRNWVIFPWEDKEVEGQ